MAHEEVSKCFDKAIYLLSPGSFSNNPEQDKYISKSSSIQLLRNLCYFKSNDEIIQTDMKFKQPLENSNNELISTLQQMMSSRDIPAPLYNYEQNSNPRFFANILQPPATYNSSSMAGVYTNGFAISPVLYSNAVYNNDVHNIYSSHPGRIGNHTVDVFNNPMTPFTGIPPHSHYYQGCQPQTINPLIMIPSTSNIASPHAGSSCINVNNLGASLIKLNNQSNSVSLQLQNKTDQIPPIKQECGDHSQKGNQTTFNSSFSLKDMMKKK